MAEHPVPSEVGASGPLATNYREETTTHEPDRVDKQVLIDAEAVTVKYRTSRGSTQQVRGDNPRQPRSYEADVKGILIGHGDNRFAYQPDEAVLRSVNRNQNVTLAEGKDILTVTTTEYPKPAPVAGAVQEDVNATVFYRSTQSEAIKSKTLEISTCEGRGDHFRFYGENEDGTDYEIVTDRQRELTLRFGDKRTLGRVVRVEFPEGHRYTVDIKGLTDDDATEIFGRKTTKVLEQAIDGQLDTRDIEVEATHDGQIER